MPYRWQLRAMLDIGILLAWVVTLTVPSLSLGLLLASVLLVQIAVDIIDKSEKHHG